ncbi:MAG: hypothetical protein KIS78_36845, partial [Labilithrix sp.]|nr:hypothetical protein [Labilithrix sp.]
LAASAEITELDRAVARAEKSVERAREVEAGARAELAQRTADRDVIVKDETRFGDRLKGRALAAEEEAAEEAARARRRA